MKNIAMTISCMFLCAEYLIMLVSLFSVFCKNGINYFVTGIKLCSFVLMINKHLYRTVATFD